MAKIKNELRNYQSIPMDLIFDSELSAMSRFVYVFMASKPDDWEFYLVPMSDELGFSVDTLRKYIKELIIAGWLIKGNQCNENGKFGAVDYTIKASNKLPSAENTVTENFRVGKIPSQHKRDYIHKQDCLHKQEEKKKEKNIDKSISQKKAEFERWWQLYDKKMGRAKCYAKWLRLSDEERALCIANTPAYVSSTPNKQYRKHPLTYLNGECWNDEIIGVSDAFVAERGNLSLGMVLSGDRSQIIEQSKKDLW